MTNLIQVAIRCVPKVANKRLLCSGPSVCPHVARLPVDGFARNFILGGGGYYENLSTEAKVGSHLNVLWS